MISSQFQPRTPGQRLHRGGAWAVAALGVVAVTVAHADIPTWQADVYYTVGSVVSYNGHSYSARISQVDYLGTGWNPTDGSLWKDLGPQPGGGKSNILIGIFTRASDTASSCALEWNTANVYTSGGLASLNGVNYKANWWTQGEDPSTHSASGGQPWTLLGSCANGSRTTVDTNESKAPPGSPAAKPPESRAAKTSAADHEG